MPFLECNLHLQDHFKQVTIIQWDMGYIRTIKRMLWKQKRGNKIGEWISEGVRKVWVSFSEEMAPKLDLEGGKQKLVRGREGKYSRPEKQHAEWGRWDKA